MSIPLYGGSVGQPGVGSSTGDLEERMKGLWRCGVSLCGSSVKGTWREGFLAGDPGGYVEKALETGISFHRGLTLGNLEEGSFSGDFERRMKGALGWGFSLSDEALRRGPLGGAPSLGTQEDMFRWSQDMGISLQRGPTVLRGTWCLRGRLVYLGTLKDGGKRAPHW